MNTEEGQRGNTSKERPHLESPPRAPHPTPHPHPSGEGGASSATGKPTSQTGLSAALLHSASSTLTGRQDDLASPWCRAPGAGPGQGAVPHVTGAGSPSSPKRKEISEAAGRGRDGEREGRPQAFTFRGIKRGGTQCKRTWEVRGKKQAPLGALREATQIHRQQEQTDVERKRVPAGLGGRALETTPRTTHSPTRTAESTGPPGLRAGRAQVAG